MTIDYTAATERGPGVEQTDNLKRIEALFAAFNDHDLDRLIARFAAAHEDDGSRLDHAAVRSLYADLLRRFPDVRLDVKEIVAIDDHIIARCVCSGTHRGVGQVAGHDGAMMVGVPATGAHFTVQHIHWWTLKDGLVVRRRSRQDDVSMLMQLGLLPRIEIIARPAGLNDPQIPHAQRVDGPEQHRNREVVMRNLAAMASKDLESMLACWASNTRNHGRTAGREGMTMVANDLFGMYTPADPQDEGQVEALAVDDCVITWSEQRLRHVGMSRIPVDGGILMGIEPTGREYLMRHIHWWRLRDGLIFDHRACRDDVAMGLELGVLQPPSA